MKTLSPFLLLSIALLTFHGLVARAETLDDLKAYSPENNNSCPYLSPFPFTTVILADPGLKCGDTTEVKSIMQKLNAWLPARVQSPTLALVLKKTDNNAFFSYYALNVPLSLSTPGGSDKAIARGVVAHEYGHAMLTYALAHGNFEFREELRLGRVYGEQMATRQLLQTKYNGEEARLIAEYEAKFGQRSHWSGAQVNEYDAAKTKLVDRYKGLMTQVMQSLAKSQEAFKGRPEKHIQLLSSYQEFFADLVAVLDAQDWTITGKIIASLAGDPKAGIPRDFTNAANRYENVEAGSTRLEAHDLFGPARFALYQRLLNNRCLKPDPAALLFAVMSAIDSESHSTIGSIEVTTPAERLMFNRQFAGAIFWRLDRLGRSICN